MALLSPSRVLESFTTVGTGTITMGGAVAGSQGQFRTFSAAGFSNGDTCFYYMFGGTDWEVGYGTYNSGTLARTTVRKSSNGNNLVSWGSGTKYVGVGLLGLTDLDDTNLGRLLELILRGAETAVASAGTCDILGAATPRVEITGTTTITSFGTGTNKIRFVRFSGVLTLTHDGTSLILPNGANITTAAGDTCIVVSDGSSNARVMAYQRADGTPIIRASTTEVLTGTNAAKAVTADALAALWEQGSNVASASTISLGEGGYFLITGTTTITDIDFATDKAGRVAILRFGGALTLTHSGTLILPTSANIVTAAGDTAIFVSEGSDTVRCVAYQRFSGEAIVGTASISDVLTGTNTAKYVTPDALAGLWEQGSNITMAADVLMGDGAYFVTSSTATVNSLNFSTPKSGRICYIYFNNSGTILKHNVGDGSSNGKMQLPGNADVTVVAGDRAIFVASGGLGQNLMCLAYFRASAGPRPSSTTDNGIARWDGTGGSLQSSQATVDDNHTVRGLGLGMGSELTATIASGAVTVARPGFLVLDTEAAAATDDLDTLTVTGVQVGDIVVIRSTSPSRDITIKDGIGNFRSNGDFVLSNDQDMFMAVWRTGVWQEVSRADNNT